MGFKPIGCAEMWFISYLAHWATTLFEFRCDHVAHLHGLHVRTLLFDGGTWQLVNLNPQNILIAFEGDADLWHAVVRCCNAGVLGRPFVKLPVVHTPIILWRSPCFKESPVEDPRIAHCFLCRGQSTRLRNTCRGETKQRETTLVGFN